MTLGVWQATTLDRQGNVRPNATVTVRDQLTNNIATIYEDADGVTPLSNPFTSDGDGFAQFFAADGLYKVTAVAAGFKREHEYVSINSSDAPSYKAAGGAILTLQTSETTVVDGDVLGRIDFQAPDEASGTDAILVPGSIWAEAEATFTASVNTTALVFATGTSEAAVERMRLSSTGLGIGTTSILATVGGVDIASGGKALIIGADNGASTRTDATAKYGRIRAPHYTNSEEEVSLLEMFSGATTNVLDFGGSNAAANAATSIRFWAAANHNTVTGTEKMRVVSSGVSIGGVSPDGTLHVHTASAGTVTANGNADDLVVENSTHAGVSILTPNSSIGYVIFGDPDNSAVGQISYNHSFNVLAFTVNGSERMRINSTGNLMIGGNATPASSVGNLVLFNGTAPTAGPANGVVLYSEDVSASAELKVMDEANNVTTLSPHNFSIIPGGKSEDMAWSFYSERDGKAVNVDMMKAVRLIEKLAGEKLVYERAA